ncbi:uncharacterized protein LOC133200177 isoform X1 [Saccostrea echinata]|uniref:uncharacterized protein LOC133200177 isoform X1 n=1 Tax=Saccostrea echinata TaxID=191078 RepID=UPI002A838B20|nr:uncharacterized protein LOC133200177 isoform X1 [Saccostrea echinata]XP_061191939.1 uncharacterized protein LOC133200177 isoform X1 [Saccostrea echinata]XP_061191940.1 uncharacterized protein LOC133200177 isoform X1 [Saccostrea echinata]
MSACREGCRRAFRGILHIPGCKTICFKCVLLPCYSNTDSDDEKDKDDEGYDSYGNTETHGPPAQESGHDTSGYSDQLTHRDYVNSVQYTNIEISETVQAQSSDNVYVPMQLESLDHLRTTQNLDTSQNNQISNNELMTCKLKVDCPNPSYVNVPESSPSLIRTDEHTVNEKSIHVSSVDVHVEEEVDSKNKDKSKQHSKLAANQGSSGKRASSDEEGAKTDIPPKCRTTIEEIHGPSEKKMVLLETDL